VPTRAAGAVRDVAADDGEVGCPHGGEHVIALVGVPGTRLPEVVAEGGAGYRADQAVDHRRAQAFGGPLRLDLAHRQVGRGDLRIEEVSLIGESLTVGG